MAVGNSGRLVIELEPELKREVRCALKERGLTMKEWLLEQIFKDLIIDQAVKSCGREQKSEKGK